ncbi:phosphate transport system ATP-binding protein [Fusobacterium naviforme]|uniref:Phosphate transport system ATP-binding protein n=1 Tax=Moryella indoligenes TaxID=371674 RepID=A0AAE3V984_9FIRM|nr:phosphate ABC transporter ATP-binding protein PstB [Moryella indoligenes]KAB0578794.1 phosphate ABC transporter ATP-binding protein [Fusobacterium naviforme]MDQ0151950.1 phosphate transport system ATP-binding protein [Moryella indoligenes]PSL11567.1 phosphate transport system ATP-binding protein [Fusobacterium naviforme]STO26649.1 Phosphate import ATP-binding protein PstB 3 [Fusobacterium naviforme]
MSSIISVRDLCLWYGNTQALKHISMEIEAHSITALIGPSGCGKSSFLKTLNRMNELIPEVRCAGQVCYQGKDIFDAAVDVNHLRRHIGMVFQKPNPFPMSIYDNVAYGPRTHGIRSRAKLDDAVEYALRAAAIWDEVRDRLKKSALGLSGGQQQRLCIARALAVQPDVLLMDEPTSALDPISTSKIEDLVQELKKNYTIIMVTHNMQQAVRISDRTAFFLMGELVEYGATEKMFECPADRRTEDYITGRFG